MARRHAKHVTSSCKHCVNGRWITDFELGHQYWYMNKLLPISAPLRMQQGYVNGAMQQDSVTISCMRSAERRKAFVFLPKYQHLSYSEGKPLRHGRESRYGLIRARREQRRVASIQVSVPV